MVISVGGNESKVFGTYRWAYGAFWGWRVKNPQPGELVWGFKYYITISISLPTETSETKCKIDKDPGVKGRKIDALRNGVTTI